MNACSACKYGKRRCTKARPSCASCLRLGKVCVYTEDAVQTQFEGEAWTRERVQEANNYFVTPRSGAETFNYLPVAKICNVPCHRQFALGACCIDNLVHTCPTNEPFRRNDGQELSHLNGFNAVHMNGFLGNLSSILVVPNSCIFDPFFSTPAPLDEQGRRAVDHIYHGSFHPLQAMRDCGLVLRVRGTAAFFQLLAFSSWHLAILRKDVQDVHTLQHAAKANRELQKQIENPATSTSVELILAVLVFASSSAQMRDPETAKIHIEGAQRILKYRGGLESLASDTSARLMVFWVETVACSFADIPTQFPPPTEYLERYKRSRQQVSQWIGTNVVDSTLSPVFSDPATVRAINAIREVLIIIRSESYKKNISHDMLFPSNHILPIFHDLLATLRRDRTLLQEGFRLAAMIFVHGLQAMCWGRIAPSLFLDKLQLLLCAPELNWSSQDPALFWILAVALTSDKATSDHRAFFLNKFGLLTKANKLTSFDDYMRKVTQISWDYEVLNRWTAAIRTYFEEICKEQIEGG